MKRIVIALAVALPFAASAAMDSANCSIKAHKLSTQKQREALAKVTEADARKAAMGSSSGLALEGGKLAVEDGCLVYSYKVKGEGAMARKEVLVDAGNANVIKTEDEGVKGRLASAKNTIVDDAHKVKDKVTGREPGTDK
ncbi:MAG TPA: hypothetical protein VN598_09355 [Usitatibacter sp.]|nr:hypothetical protein [Usitatibacter sp.]